MRKTDGSAPIRLGEGVGSLSPDGSRVAIALPGTKAAAKVVPIGAGEPVNLPTEGMEAAFMAWYPDNRTLLFSGRSPGRPWRFLRIDTATGANREIAFEGAALVQAVSPDSRRVLARRTDGTWALYPIDGGGGVPVPGIPSEDFPLEFADDGAVLAATVETIPVRLYRLNLATGEKTTLKEFAPPDKAGVPYVRDVLVSGDGSSYAYQYRRWLSSIFVATGLK